MSGGFKLASSGQVKTPFYNLLNGIRFRPMKPEARNHGSAVDTYGELQQGLRSIREMTPLEALQVWLDGKVGIEEEEALLEALRKDKQIRLSDEEILDFVFEAMETDLDAKQCLERLQLATRAED